MQYLAVAVSFFEVVITVLSGRTNEATSSIYTDWSEFKIHDLFHSKWSSCFYFDEACN